MPQQPASWPLETGGAHVLDLDTAVKDGILGGPATGGAAPLDTATTDKLDLRKMIEEIEASLPLPPTEEFQEVPAVFICPISLEPMEDPVTLCTGQTYERRNIERWLTMGRSVCPTTMQDLWNQDLVPNRTLRHLILSWFSLRLIRIRKLSHDVASRASHLASSLPSLKGQPRLAALRDLRSLAASHSSVHKPVAKAGGVHHLSSLLGPFTSHAVGSEVVAILVSMCDALDADAKAGLMQPAKISLLVDMLNEGIVDTKINCTKLISLLMDEKSFLPELVSSYSLLVGLLRMAKDRRHPNGIAAGISLLEKICTHLQLRPFVVTVGTVPHIVDMLLDLNPVSCLEPALHMLEMLALISEGKKAMKDYPQVIPNMVKLLMRVSEACTGYALSILWAVCELAPEECAPVAVEAGLAAKLLLVIQSGSAPELKQRAAELLKLCSLNYNVTHFMSKCKLTRTIQ